MTAGNSPSLPASLIFMRDWIHFLDKTSLHLVVPSSSLVWFIHKYHKYGSLLGIIKVLILLMTKQHNGLIWDANLEKRSVSVSQFLSRQGSSQWGKFGEAVPGLFFLRATFIVGNPLPAHKGQTVESALTLSPVSSGRLRFPYWPT